MVETIDPDFVLCILLLTSKHIKLIFEVDCVELVFLQLSVTPARTNRATRDHFYPSSCLIY